MTWLKDHPKSYDQELAQLRLEPRQYDFGACSADVYTDSK